MKRSTKGILIVSIAAAIGFVALTAHLTAFALETRSMVARAKQSRQRLFYETDYDELLAACRELSARAVEGELEPKRYVLSEFWGDPDPNAATFPRAVLDLKPILVDIDMDGTVRLELARGFGVHAFPQDQHDWGDLKLIDGLWYYDSTYQTDPKYRNRIDRMIEKSQEHRP